VLAVTVSSREAAATAVLVYGDELRKLDKRRQAV
jgi:hypothetical protein